MPSVFLVKAGFQRELSTTFGIKQVHLEFWITQVGPDWLGGEFQEGYSFWLTKYFQVKSQAYNGSNEEMPWDFLTHPFLKLCEYPDFARDACEGGGILVGEGAS